MRIATDCFEETVRLGLRLGRILGKGDIVCLTGVLGTGKTALAKGIAAAMGVKGHVTSPTFTIVNEYEGRIPVYHFDVYRISDPDEMFDIGFEEYIDGSGLVIIEWADLIKPILPGEYIWVYIQKGPDDCHDRRTFYIDFVGGRYEGYERKLKDDG